jgi:hypothetical protein
MWWCWWAVEVKVDETDWEYEQELALLDEGLRLIANRLRADETKKMVNAIEVGCAEVWADPTQRQVKRQLLEPVEIALSQPTPGMWDTVLRTYRDVSKTAEETYLAKAKSQSIIVTKTS